MAQPKRKTSKMKKRQRKAANHFFRIAQAEAPSLLADIQAGKATLMDFAEGEF